MYIRKNDTAVCKPLQMKSQWLVWRIWACTSFHGAIHAWITGEQVGCSRMDKRSGPRQTTLLDHIAYCLRTWTPRTLKTLGAIHGFGLYKGGSGEAAHGIPTQSAMLLSVTTFHLLKTIYFQSLRPSFSSPPCVSGWVGSGSLTSFGRQLVPGWLRAGRGPSGPYGFSVDGSFRASTRMGREGRKRQAAILNTSWY